MKAANLEITKNRFSSKEWKSSDIIAYGEFNDYPQSARDVLQASYTGVSCMSNYKKFIFGKGFSNEDYNITVNSDGHSLDDVLKLASDDLAMFGGLCLHLNFNMLGQIVEMRHIPFENARLCKEGEDVEHSGMIALYEDWGLRKNTRIKMDDVEYYDRYDGDVELLLNKLELFGAEYTGQIYYWSNQGNEYPMPIYDAVLTDMNTQEAISNITNRNAKNGFLPSCLFINVANGDEDTTQADENIQVLKRLSGDMNASRIAYFEVASKEEAPIIEKIDVNNYDAAFETSRTSVEESIGQAFNQPPILRSKDVSAGLGAQIMRQSYDYYNSVTEGERIQLEAIFSNLVKRMSFDDGTIIGDLSITPLTYGDVDIQSLGKDGVASVVELLKDAALANAQKRTILSTIYHLNDALIDDLLMENQPETTEEQ